ncbi:hypothetical protein [Roseateles violae]|uniref:Uncharacterized protein n=1 Tax=Roseateles violae TaxID=3058042 RepID=A0ABT8DMH0_9BURK|nr:hypothetical protein [Pelomonas sp. PFR6]MDN3919191.1 hypothetical protein [Pelomonas sp. PFR6]
MRSTEPLYRSVNTRTQRVHHGVGGEFRHGRNSKDARRLEDAPRTPMHGRHRHGRDYTPLYRFLLSRVGRPWDEVYAEVKPRMDGDEPIFWMVARPGEERRERVRVGESSYFSGLYIDEADGVLRLVNPGLDADTMWPSCPCCTHTFNGKRFGLTFEQGLAGA